MSLIKNIQRLSWRFSSGKSFEPNDNDINALNDIIDWINKEKEQRINDNRYFAKIVIYCYINELRFYKDNRLSENKIQEILDKPLPYWYEEYQKEINRKELNETIEILNINDPWETFKSNDGSIDVKKIEEATKANNDLIKTHQNEIIKAFNGFWELEDVTGKLNYFISELLTIHGNKP